MRSPAAERTLRRLVVQLGAMAPDDVDAVLDSLSPMQAEEVRGLLADYLTPPRVPVPAPPPATFAPAPPPVARPAEPEPAVEEDLTHLSGLAPWLADRVNAAEGRSANGGGFRMTPTALSALADLARRLPPEAPIASPVILARRSRPAGLFQRFLRGAGDTP